MQVNKFSFILNKLFKVDKNDLISNQSMYDRFLEARLVENLFNICLLINSIFFMQNFKKNMKFIKLEIYKNYN